MGIATVLSRAQYGMEAPLVQVEVDLGNGLPAFTIVGLPEAVVKESKDRVRAALTNCNFELPSGKITVNLAPADLPKEGGRFDLPIAIGILAASGQVPMAPLANCELYGELSLSGAVRPIKGALPAALAAHRADHMIILPTANASEASLVAGSNVAQAAHLLEVCAHFGGVKQLAVAQSASKQDPRVRGADLSEVRGQAHAKRALEVAAAGAHSLLFVGPPGTGKSMLAQRLLGLLPPMTDDEALEAAAVRSVSGRGLNIEEWRLRPFRAPHHTASPTALVGGGSHPRPGEISLAHNGVLFLDELPEFDRRVLEVLREPLETGVVSISRAARQADFPSRFQLIAAMNPCACGYLNDASGKCRCTSDQVQRYRGRISGPLLDRLDLHVEVLRVDPESLRERVADGDTSAQVAPRVRRARDVQAARQGCCNARLDSAGIDAHCLPTREGQSLLERAMKKFALSARAYHRVLKVARTIADLAGEERIATQHVSEAMSMRQLDRVARPR